jgi:hypothetical protein
LQVTQCIVFRATGYAEMIDKALPPKIECYDIPETKPNAEPNPFRLGEFVRLRDGTAANGTVSGILGNEVRVAWEGVAGDPQWYHQDYLLKEKRPAERGRAPAREEKPDAKPNPFKIGETVRLRDGTFTNGTVKGILGNEVRVAWDNVPGDPQWYHQDFILAEKRVVERSRTSPENQAEKDIVDQACRLVAVMDDDQRRRFIAHMQETYK